MIIRILAVGKLRGAYYRAGVEDYVQRIGKFVPIEHVEVPAGEGGAEKEDVRGVLQREAGAIAKRLSHDELVVVLDPQGELLSTERFSEWLGRVMSASTSRVTFVIGGAWGLASSVRARACLCWSLSPLTFPHEMARLIVAEQIYRALCIWKGLPYHK